MYGTKKLRVNFTNFEMITQTPDKKLGYFEDGIEKDTELDFPTTLEMPVSFIKIDGNIVLESDEKLSLKEIVTEELMIKGDTQYYFNVHKLCSCALIENNTNFDLFELKMVSGKVFTVLVNNTLTSGWINKFSRM